RALDGILIDVRAQFFLAVRLFELAEAQLKLINAMDVDIKIAQQSAGGIGEIAFDFEIKVTCQPSFSRQTGAAYQKRICWMIARPVAAIIELGVAADLRLKAAISTAQERMVLIPARNHYGLVWRLCWSLRRCR